MSDNVFATLGECRATCKRHGNVKVEIVNENDNSDTPNPSGEAPSTSVNHHPVEMGPDGYPMIFMKFSQKQGDKVSFEIKPYRASFIRAALMVTSAKQEAQLQVSNRLNFWNTPTFSNN